MRTVKSPDGTRIAIWESGSGPPLLLVHGATADHTTTWRFVLPAFERSFTVYAMDRRGRGGSGDGPEYSLSREAEDVAAVVEAIGGEVNVVGHSYGGLCSFEASLLTSGIRRLVLYEGVPMDGSRLYAPGAVERLRQLIESGDLEGMLVSIYRDIVQMPANELELMRGQKEAWEVRKRNAPTLPRELATEEAYRFIPGRFAAMRTPVLLLVGGDSPARELENATGVSSALPDARVQVLPGQQHVAMHTAPDLFVRAVSEFLE